MKININETSIDKDVLSMLIDHFKYSIEDINSYDELTEMEKSFISIYTWNKLINTINYES